MFKAIKYIFEQGRKRAYSDIIVELTSLENRIARSREGQLVRLEVIETIKRLKGLQKDEV